jgi:hypothetical protein
MRFIPVMIFTIALLVVGVGCSQPFERLNAPPQGFSENPCETQDQYIYMVDNAMLEDLSLADIHFVPHTAELNGLGARRLERYAKLLSVYGGTLRYTGTAGDEKLTEDRMASIRTYLATTGIGQQRIKVVQGMPGGNGMSANEAIAAKANTIGAAAGGEARGGRGKGPMAALTGLLGGGR